MEMNGARVCDLQPVGRASSRAGLSAAAKLLRLTEPRSEVARSTRQQFLVGAMDVRSDRRCGERRTIKRRGFGDANGTEREKNSIGTAELLRRDGAFSE